MAEKKNSKVSHTSMDIQAVGDYARSLLEASLDPRHY